MTDNDYYPLIRGAHQRLAIVMQQVDEHLGRAHSNVSLESIAPLLQRIGEICDELATYDRDKSDPA